MKMSSSSAFALCWFIGCWVVYFALWSFDCLSYLTQRQAIEANVAEWRIDATTGEKSFAWKECDGS